ncbi:MAG: hypothetical protein ACP5HM_00845 [Anaerolineae bacterium]
MTVLEERWLWLTGSVLLAVLVSWIRWLFLRPHENTPPWLLRWQRWPGRPWVEAGLHLLYAVGVPAAALIWRGALTERGLGLQPLLWPQEAVALELRRANWQDWVQDVGWTLGFAGATALVFGLAEVQRRRLTPQRHVVERDAGRAVYKAFCRQSHWAFYREPFVLLWGATTGSWVGLLPALLEAALNPQRWEELQSPFHGRDLLGRLALAVMSTLVFLRTGNSWCALGADMTLSYLWGTARPADTPPPSDQDEG